MLSSLEVVKVVASAFEKILIMGDAPGRFSCGLAVQFSCLKRQSYEWCILVYSQVDSRDWSDYQDTKVLLDIVAQVEPWSEGDKGNGPKRAINY